MAIEKPLYQEQNIDSNKMSIAEVTKILNDHKHLNFVDRILNASEYMPYPIRTEGKDKGKPYSHMMGTWGNLDDSDAGYVIPTVIWTSDKGYQEFENAREAYNYAMKTGEYLKFKNHTEADKFQNTWKEYWGEKKKDNG